MKRRVLLTSFFLILAATSASGLQLSEEFKVTEVFLKADDARPTGPCPLRVTFRGYITANGPGTIKYRFTRSDGATGPVYVMEFKSAGTQPVLTDRAGLRSFPRSGFALKGEHGTEQWPPNCRGGPPWPPVPGKQAYLSRRAATECRPYS